MPKFVSKFAHRSVCLPLAALLLAGTMLNASGCMRPKKTRLAIDVPADIAWNVKAPVDLDISNASGTVDIRHKTDIKEPWIDVKRSRPRPTTTDQAGEMGGPGRNPSQFAEARLVPGTGGGNSTIVIKSTAGDLGSPDEWARITVWVPSLGSVKITNSGGYVNVNNPGGTVEIRNQTTKAGSGNITIRTGKIDHDVTLVSDGGSVEFSTHPDSSLRFDCNTGTGQVHLTSQGVFSGVSVKPGSWSGVLNAGQARCTINTANGEVKLKVVR